MEKLYCSFDNFTKLVEWAIGTPWAFVLACGTIGIWLLCGPFFGWSSEWQLVINSATTVLTWLMLFTLQSAQNRGNLALNVKIDELLRAVADARTSVVLAEDMDSKELGALHDELREAAEKDSTESLAR